MKTFPVHFTSSKYNRRSLEYLSFPQQSSGKLKTKQNNNLQSFYIIILKVLLFGNKQTTKSLFRGSFRLSGSTPKLPERLPEPWNGVWKCLIPDWTAILVEALWVHTVTPGKKNMFTSSTFHCGEAAYYINTGRFFLTGAVASLLEMLHQFNIQVTVCWGGALRKHSLHQCSILHFPSLDFYK